ncbi:TetR family transcriptional regulator [Saccharobesus litoralis]|uniref:TetR family transcriptional regulator n=1 Tax=Saccharobesus litoralis TaxID=2172099 RepID=A0A2S0VT02_9ALTE|nr:TetR/AcrR family transcriptional regulator [Saccharobesus litoralis]AWB67346.1 TetR family transcriptional regulator [Saccharobesus litoralis]
MSRHATKERILAAAEQLFAEQGFDNTSLREITNKAEVNLAAVNYHFGSKKTLIQAVLDQYFSQFVPKVCQSLTALMQASRQVSVDCLFHAFIEPLLSLNNLKKNGTERFMSLVGHGYSESQGHLRRFFHENYGQLLPILIESVQTALPSVSKPTIFWRLHYTLGSVVFTMTSKSALAEIAEVDFQQQVSTEQLIKQLIPFLAAGMSAPDSQSNLQVNV